MANTDFSVIIPVYNEEDNIQLIYNRLTSVMEQLEVSYELIFINDGSKDNTLALVKALANQKSNVKFIDFSRNFGHQIAVSAGIDNAVGETICIIDADLQDPPELIIDMYQKIKEGYDVVYAKRKKRAGDFPPKIWAAKIFYRILAKLTSFPIPVDTGDFRLINKQIVEVLKQMPEKSKYLRGQIAWIGFKQTFVEFDRDPRFGGKSNYTFRKLLKLALDGITGFSDIPLKVVTYFGLLVSIFAFLMSLYVLWGRFISNNHVPAGWASTIISVLFIGGIQMIGIGIIGEYISRMNHDLRNRPLYIIKETNVKK